MRANNATTLGDSVLPLSVVAVVGIMIFPLPSGALDALLLCNLTFALVLLVSSVYLSEPQRFTSLPTILLLATIFRLGLNIATTRQILGGSEVPDVVMTFGEFVVQGNIVVGLVIFIIITLVQFLVIAKGAERVAEVAARFTLDAMPGKQMSIDADIRAGILSLAEARERRQELQVESKLFGALDGSMKFVKGDAIAGIVITIINIIAGFIIGVSSLGLSMSEAARRYTLFTIGDGLVSQIPALLVATAAGIAVTRVSDTENLYIGRDMMGQLAKEPQALYASAGVLSLLAFVPGLPTFAFLLMAAVLVVIGQSTSQKRARQHAANKLPFRPNACLPLMLRLSNGAAASLHEEGALPEQVTSYRQRVFNTQGVLLPEIQFELASEQSGAVVEFYVRGAKVVELDLNSTEGSKSAAVIRAIESGVAACLSELLDDTHTRTLLELHQPIAEDLINNVVPEQLSVTGLTNLLKELIREGVSIKNLSTILQAVAEHRLKHRHDGGGSAVVIGPGVSLELLIAVRAALKRSITASLALQGNAVACWAVHPELDALLAKAACGQAVLNPLQRKALIESVKELRRSSEEDSANVLLSSPISRRYIAELFRGELGSLKVLALEEIAPEVEVHVYGELRAGLNENPDPTESREFNDLKQQSRLPERDHMLREAA